MTSLANNSHSISKFAIWSEWSLCLPSNSSGSNSKKQKKCEYARHLNQGERLTCNYLLEIALNESNNFEPVTIQETISVFLSHKDEEEWFFSFETSNDLKN